MKSGCEIKEKLNEILLALFRIILNYRINVGRVIYPVYLCELKTIRECETL